MFKTVFFNPSTITVQGLLVVQGGQQKELTRILNKIRAEMIFISVRCRKHITLIQTKFKDQGLR